MGRVGLRTSWGISNFGASYERIEQLEIESDLRILRAARARERKIALHTAECRKERERWVYNNSPCPNCGQPRGDCGGECYE